MLRCGKPRFAFAVQVMHTVRGSRRYMPQWPACAPNSCNQDGLKEHPRMELAARGPGLYDPRNEHDSCGVGFVVNIKGRKSHDIIRRGLEILVNLDHRGAVG